ncbi:MAG: hypothetical protein IJY21_04615 [Clostridia bacterium]|nr:hypothetical protein [Clostridia bacterium]
MSQFELYIFTLCLIVFVLLTAIFTAFVVCLVRMYLKMTDAGVNDEKIKKEYLKEQGKKPSVFGMIMDKAVLVLCCAVLFLMFGFGVSVSAGEGKTAGNTPVLNVVQSGSMSYINKNHKYLKPGQADNQMQMFDLIFISKLPKEEDLRVNDIVVYETDGVLIIHRIVGIEAPNEQHPDETYFLLQGDANEVADKFPVRYNQMKGIYRGHRIPFIGSFVLFMQSPAGYLCVLLVVFALIATPMAEKKIKKAKENRLFAMGLLGGTQVQEIQTDELAATELESNELPIAANRFAGFGKSKSFVEKLALSKNAVKYMYADILSILGRIEDIEVTRGKKGEIYRCANKRVCKISFRGKTLNVYLALKPKDFENTKYIFEDVSDKKGYRSYAMRIKLTSARQVKWTKELIEKLCEIKGFRLAKEPITDVSMRFTSFKKAKSFTYKLRTADAGLKDKYKKMSQALKGISRVRAIRGKKGETYRSGNKGICKLAIRGKTLNVYFALDPKAYENTKYIYKDVSSSKTYENYAMRVKLTSDRQVRWAIELLDDLARQKDLEREVNGDA